MRRAMMWLALAACLGACPSRGPNPPGDFPDAMRDVEAGSRSGDADVAEVDADAGDADAGPDITMTYTFTSVGLYGDAGAVSMQANIHWQGALRGDAGSISFEGTIR